MFGGLEKQLAQLTTASKQKGKNDAEANDGVKVLGNLKKLCKRGRTKSKIAEDKFKVALKEEMGEGLINIDRQEDKVIITVGSGGAFKSGSADLHFKS